MKILQRYFCLFLLLAAGFRTAAGCPAEDAPPSPHELIFAAADGYAAELLSDPPEGLSRGDIAMAFGWIYLNGMLGQASPERAEEYLEAALREGLPEAAVVLGAIRLNLTEEPGAPRDPAAAAEYYEQAAAAGCVDAFRVLGLLYLEGGDGIAPDPEKARRNLTEAARRGSETALDLLQPMLGTDGLPEDPEDLIDPELTAEARARSARIAEATGRVFDLLERRLERLELEIESGDQALPLAELARMSPEEQARYWERLTAAADAACLAILDSQPDEKTRGDAALVMGVLHHLGFVYGADPGKARGLMEYALERDVIEARVALGELLLDMTLHENGVSERDTEAALQHLAAAAEADSPDAHRFLGMLYTTGSGEIEPDPEAAERYFLAAARHGDPEALRQLEPLFARARAWEEAHPGEKSALPTGPEAAVVPELAAAAERRTAELSAAAGMVDAELGARMREFMLGEKAGRGTEDE